MSGVKIAMIGGGSAFCPVFIQALVDLQDSFRGSQLVLMDVDAYSLALIHKLGCRMSSAAEAEIEILQTTNRKEAIHGADFVVTSFRPGGFEARALDEKIPLKYDIIGQETVGPGGFFMALRSIAVIKEIVAEMEELAPGAFLLNYTNPTNIVTEAVSHHTPINVIGMCDQLRGDARRLANALGLELSSLYYEACGLNHATWSTRFTIDAQDGMPLIMRSAPAVLGDREVPAPVKRMFKLAQRYKRIPNRYLQYYYFHEEILREAKQAPMCRAEEIMAELPSIFAHYEAESEKERPVLVKMRGGTRAFGDFAVDVMKAIVEDSNTIFVLNVSNRGAVPGFDAERVVEVPCLVNRRGAHPLAQERLPKELMGLLKMLAEYQALTAKAAWKGTRQDAVKALVANPLVLSLPRAEALYDEMARAHANYLPEPLL